MWTARMRRVSRGSSRSWWPAAAATTSSAYCVYLVDTFCLGVKNVHGSRSVSEDELRSRILIYFARYPAPPIVAPLELAQCLVLGGADYAASLGFSPHPELAAARSFLGEPSGSCPIAFGMDGRPLYVAGPYDNQDYVINTLRRTVGGRNFEYVISVF